jgi:chromosome segregation protein
MKYISTICVLGTILFSFGCQQSQQTVQSSSSVDRKSRLMAAENISIKEELAKTKRELETLNKQLTQIKEENEKLKKLSSINYVQLESMKKTVSGSNQVIADLKKQLETCQNMVEEKGEPALCKYKIQQQKKLLAECEKTKKEIQESGDASTSFLMEQLPADLMKQVETCTQENHQLQEKIAELEKQIKDVNSAN